MSVDSQHPYKNMPADDRYVKVSKEDADALVEDLTDLMNGTINGWKFTSPAGLIPAADAASTHKLSFVLNGTTYYFLVIVP